MSSHRKPGVTYEKNKDGSKNPLFVDVLEEDKPIAGQGFCCVSFISPEEILEKKELFMMQKFLNGWDMTKSMEKFHVFLSFISTKYNIKLDKLMSDLEEFVEVEKESLASNTLVDDYKTFLEKNEDKLQKEFDKKNNFQTSVRGLKIRGSFPTQEEAELRCKLLRDKDPAHDIYVAPVGVWLPYHPVAYKTGRVEYLNSELNQLMIEKKKNEEKAKEEFDQRLRENKRKIIEENVRKARENMNKLSQTIDENGNLIGVDGMNTQETFLTSMNKNGEQNVSLDDLKKVLFEGDNIITSISKNEDHGLSSLTNQKMMQDLKMKMDEENTEKENTEKGETVSEKEETE